MNRLISIIKLTVLLIIGSALLSSCKDDVTFAAENKTMIDTMFLSRKNIMKDEIDSLCQINNEEFYQVAIDSIMDARIAEIEIRLNSLKTKSAIR